METFLDLVKRRQSAHSFTNKRLKKKKLTGFLKLPAFLLRLAMLSRGNLLS
jgi:hypothetical protein